MTDQDLIRSVQRLYWLTASFGAIGFVSYFEALGPRAAAAFALGALGSFGNLWVFVRLTRGIAPGDEPRKPWTAALFIIRFLALFLLGYVIVITLGVDPLAVVLGLFASTAAVVTSIIVELIQGLVGNHSTR